MQLDNYPIISTINLQKIKYYSKDELALLASEIRRFLVTELSKNGGHLASNLGAVELTIALFRQFNSPYDKFFWDIGHQTYVHKILTGRAARFDTLRQYNGLSGFIKSSESEHDIWEAGHASTSLSGATGMSIQRKLQHEKFHIVSIIGDGALTGGMALEALNHIGDLQLPHIIVLNDNEMSISKNVGALNKHITDLRMNPKYLKVKSGTKFVLSKNQFGEYVKNILGNIKESFKHLLITNPNDNFFANMGISYLGPIDGHNIEQLEAAFTYAKKMTIPVVIHIITKKGKGYIPAETDEKGAWHGIGPYSIREGQKIRKKERSQRLWSSIISETVERLAMQDDSIIAITPAMIKGSKLTHFAEKFPQRIFDVGIAEEHAMTFAAGTAINNGLKPFIAIYSSFLQRAYDQVLHDIARQHLPVVIGVDRCGFAGGDGETHHGIYDIALLRTIPEIIIAMGKDDIETQHLLYNAFYQYHSPIAIRYPRGYSELNYVSQFQKIPCGTWEVLEKAKNAEYIILTFGSQIRTAQKIRAYFAQKDNISIVNARFLKPLDEKMLHQIFQKYQKVITIEEGTLNGGFGSAICDFAYQYNYHAVPIYRQGLADVYYPQGDNATLQKLAGIDADSIIKKIEEVYDYE